MFFFSSPLGTRGKRFRRTTLHLKLNKLEIGVNMKKLNRFEEKEKRLDEKPGNNNEKKIKVWLVVSHTSKVVKVILTVILSCIEY